MRLNLNAKAEGFYGMFNDFGTLALLYFYSAQMSVNRKDSRCQCVHCLFGGFRRGMGLRAVRLHGLVALTSCLHIFPHSNIFSRLVGEGEQGRFVH